MTYEERMRKMGLFRWWKERSFWGNLVAALQYL